MKRLALVLLPVFAVFLMSHNVSAAQRMGNYQNFLTRGLGGLPSSLGYNIHYSVTASTNLPAYIANGEFSNSVNWVEGQEYNLLVFAYMNANNNSQSRFPNLVPEAIVVQGENYHSLDDVVRYSRSCNNSLNCTTIVMHEIKIVADGTGSELVKFRQSNLFNIADFWVQNNATAVIDFDAKIFDNADEWAEFKAELLTKLDSINSDTTDILNAIDDINDKLNALDSNADKEAEAWDNMQDTDGLIDVGDNQSFMDSFNSVNNFFGGLKNKTAGDCTLNGDLGVMNLGTLNLCEIPQNIKDMVGVISGVVFAVFDILIVWNSIHYIVGIIDWARRN